MCKVVHKFNVSKDTQMPTGAKVIHVGYQDGEIKLWAEVDSKIALFERRHFEVIPTGFAELPDNSEHVGTVVNQIEGTVWHVYEVRDN